MSGPVPSPGLRYPAKAGGFVYIRSRINDECDVWMADEAFGSARIGIRTVAEFWQLVK